MTITNLVMPTPAAVPPPFGTMLDLRATHRDLLQRQRCGTALDEIADAVMLFVQRALATGAILDTEDHRVAVQGLIDYWCTTLYRLDIKIHTTELAEFDISAAPTLPDHLCPYVGLAAFDEQTSDRFFGREQLVRQATERLIASERFLAILGPSGSGKSSIVLAGLLPMLKSGGMEGSQSWRYVSPMVPGSDPLANLASLFPDAPDLAAKMRASESALLAQLANEPAVIVVDQLEEIFTLCDEEEARNAFLNNLAAIVETPSPAHRLFVTIRSDYEPRLNKYPRLQKLIEKGLLRATPLSAAELRASIEKPAERIGLKLEAGLVDELVNDVLGEPAALPLLQYAMLRLWQARDHNRITLAAYRRLGNSRVALGQAADELYSELLPEDQTIMRKIFMRMVRPAAGEETTRRRIAVAELEKIGHAPANVMRVLEKLIEARLVRRSGCETDPQVEVAHEALIRNWPRFGTWLEERRAELLHGRRLEALAEEWERFGRESGFLDDAQIVDAEKWLASEEAAEIGVHESLRALVVASRALMDDRLRRERRAKMILAGIAVAVVVILFAALWRAYRAVSRENEQNVKIATLNNRAFNAERQRNALQALQLAEQREESEHLKKDQEEKQRLMDELQKKVNELSATRDALIAEREESKAYSRQLEQYTAEYKAPMQASPATLPRLLVRPEALGLHKVSRPIRSGASIGSRAGYGSACCVVQAEDGQRYLLTLAMMFEGPGEPVYQPGGSKQHVGTVVRVGKERFNSGALVKLDPKIDIDATFPQYGPIRGVADKVRVGDQLRAVGRGSGLSIGSIAAMREYDYVTTIDSQPGDSGAPVVNSRNELVGLIYGGDGDTSFVLPIEPLLRELGVTLVVPAAAE